MNLNLKAKKQNTYDAIVVGTGISGGWAAKELTENGLNTLVLERGRDVPHGDYPTGTATSRQNPNDGSRLNWNCGVAGKVQMSIRHTRNTMINTT